MYIFQLKCEIHATGSNGPIKVHILWCMNKIGNVKYKEDLITTFQSNERCIHHEKEITEKPASHPIPNKHERCILVLDGDEYKRTC